MASRGYKIDQSPLYKLSNKRKLATILQMEYATLLHAKEMINYTVSEIEKVLEASELSTIHVEN